nr:hypothetical protein [Bacillus fungorum]
MTILTPNVPISTLESLPLNEARAFQRYLHGVAIKTRVINRTCSALKSLFKYLAQNTENEQREKYISRNVMEKFELHKEKVDAASRADDVTNMIFNEKMM